MVFSLCFNLDHFNSLSLSSGELIKIIFYLFTFIFRVTIWYLFMLIVFVFMLKFPLCSHMPSTFSMSFLTIFIIVMMKPSLITLGSYLDQMDSSPENKSDIFSMSQIFEWWFDTDNRTIETEANNIYPQKQGHTYCLATM